MIQVIKNLKKIVMEDLEEGKQLTSIQKSQFYTSIQLIYIEESLIQQAYKIKIFFYIFTLDSEYFLEDETHQEIVTLIQDFLTAISQKVNKQINHFNFANVFLSFFLQNFKKKKQKQKQQKR
ncbi:hypothetical protein TTHERM_00399670 (macronuclear) [Tetrahymena thermophila SB210]|uniref:Uncharacterized protein n=1 Tax=Tetrahymena thermophila (strain SB210) TaxID=312017 RepID=I7LUH7_TETTS|nr:hypothetical protein TTHERM_00399670 [Tetrahymena thermophila SB210]EAR93794.2 hypothetical protein TTHERM_00399670 [Tetrahymena thermophila SB210]|eukprot:XP_001014039.2 hypothetical protein TTHERM_00399670 [Tetrahymena thermophila SB210]